MKEIKKVRTIEETSYTYEAFDGTVFYNRNECVLYEQSALGAAKAAAWHYFVGERSSEAVFNSCCEDSLLVFDIPDGAAYQAVRMWAELDKVWDANLFTPVYIGKRVAFYSSCGEYYFEYRYATKEDLIQYLMEGIEALFADKPETI